MFDKIPKYLFYPPIRRIDSDTPIYLGEQISSVDVASNIDRGSQLALEVCQQIDDEISPVLNRSAETEKMRFALALAFYKARIQTTIYLNLAQALEYCSGDLIGAAVECPDVVLDNCIHSHFRFPEIVKKLLPDWCAIEIRSVAPTASPTSISHLPSFLQRIIQKIHLAKNNPWRAWNRLVDAFHIIAIRFFTALKVGFDGKGGRILMFHPYLILHDIGIRGFRNNELLLCSEESFSSKRLTKGQREFDSVADNIRNRFGAEETISREHIVRSLLADDILREMSFCLWEKNFLAKLIGLRCEVERRPVVFGIWSISPVSGFGSILFEFLMSHGVPVIGYQHGGPNECQYHAGLMPELMRCTDFVSWGGSEEDLARISPREHLPCRIHPFGWMNTVYQTPKREMDFDLLFPITNTMHMFEGGMIREKAESLFERQIRLLDYLEGLSGVRIAVKPFPGANKWNCGVFDRLVKLRNVKVFWNIPLVSFIKRYRFQGVIIEFPSKPLYESLSLDVEIFLHLDSVLKIESVALDELEKRVHCFSGVDPMMRSIDAFLRGELPSRRDDRFCRHYVSRPGAKENFLQLVRDMLQKTDKQSSFSAQR